LNLVKNADKSRKSLEFYGKLNIFDPQIDTFLQKDCLEYFTSLIFRKEKTKYLHNDLLLVGLNLKHIKSHCSTSPSSLTT